MASRKKTRHGASASARNGTRTRARSATRSASSTRTSGRSPARGSKRESFSRGPAILFVSVALLAVAVWAFYPVARLQYQEERERARLESELEGLKERNADLRAQVERLKTPEGVEEIARQDLGMVKEGENVYVVMDAEESSGTVTQGATPAQADGDGIVYEVLDLVFGLKE